MDIQRMLGAMQEAMKNTRSEYHLTLGKAIDKLSSLPADAVILFDWNSRSPCEPHSYRGYYSDLALESSDTDRSVKDVLADLSESLGQEFYGYKGGEFVMGKDTPLWAAEYGYCGRAVVGLTEVAGKVILLTKEDDDDD